jgi:hypothetical protein
LEEVLLSILDLLDAACDEREGDDLECRDDEQSPDVAFDHERLNMALEDAHEERHGEEKGQKERDPVRPEDRSPAPRQDVVKLQEHKHRHKQEKKVE